MAELEDTRAIREFMDAFGHVTLDEPLDNPDERLRLLRGRLVIEEAFELLEALGLKVALNPDEEPRFVNPKDVVVEVDEDKGFDQLEVADALADIIVVTKGGGLAFGLPVDRIILEEVAVANMNKLDPVTKKPILREDGKILKPEGWEPPNVKRVVDSARSPQ